jgi:hypothetical protein
LLTADPTSISELQVAHLTAKVLDSSCGSTVQWSADEPGLSILNDSAWAVFTAPEEIESPRRSTISAWAAGCPESKTTLSLSLIHQYHWQGLVQLQNGMARASMKPRDLLHQGYQVVFHDNLTGAELWQIDGDESPGSVAIPGILNRTPWNSNGSLFVLNGTRCIPGKYCPDSHNFVYEGDGSFAHPLDARDPTRMPAWAQTINVSGYAPFDKEKPNLIYYVAGPESFPTNTSRSVVLYEIDVANGDIARKLAELPQAERRKMSQAGISEGNILMIQDLNPGRVKEGEVPKYIPNLYFFDLHTHKMIYSYPINFGLTFAGHSKDEEYHLHDIAFRRNPQSSYIFNYGTRGDVGEAIIIEMPIDGDPHKARLACKDPATRTPYYSHPAWNSDGSLVAYGGERILDGVPWDGGTFVRNHEEHKTLAKIGLSSNHIGWDGYDPNYIVFDGWNNTHSYNLQHALTDGSRSLILVQYPPREQDKGPSMITGPAQSPDATKVMFTIPLEFVADRNPKTFIVVDHRPIAPKLAAVTTTPPSLQWTPYLTHREVKGYRVYRSSKPNGGYTEISNGLMSETNFTDSSAEVGSIYYYAVTSEEFSGLETDSPALLRIVAGGPSSLVEWKNEYNFLGTPEPPDHIVATQTKPGVWKVSWNASISSSVKYYNIYYSTSGVPKPRQAYLISSVPASQGSFTYWVADPKAPAAFAVLAVDRQGHVSAQAVIQGANVTVREQKNLAK